MYQASCVNLDKGDFLLGCKVTSLAISQSTNPLAVWNFFLGKIIYPFEVINVIHHMKDDKVYDFLLGYMT